MIRDPQIRLYAEDEVHFQQRTSVIRMWWPRGTQPEIPSAPTRAQIGYWGAVDIKAGSLCTTPEEGKFNWITFQGFLEDFLRRKYRSGQELAMIIDNAGYHKKKELWPFFAENRKRLRMLWLPPYSPDLNPIERVWRLTRRQVTHNRYFECVFRTKLAIDSDRKLATDSGLKLATYSGRKLATFTNGPEWVANIAPE